MVKAQATGVRPITGVFKAPSAQTLNIEAHLTPIDMKLDKKTIQTAGHFFSEHLYHIITQGQFPYMNRTLTQLETLQKYYVKLVGCNIEEHKKRPAYIVPPW